MLPLMGGATVIGSGGSGVAVTVVLAVGPLACVAVMVAVPSESAVARPPDAVMVVTVGLLLVHVTAVTRVCVLLSLYVPVAVNWRVRPMVLVGFWGLMVRLTRTGAVTVNAVFTVIPAACVAVIVVSPTVRAVARPPGEAMVATPMLLLAQATLPVRSWVVPSVKVPVAVNWTV